MRPDFWVVQTFNGLSYGALLFLHCVDVARFAASLRARLARLDDLILSSTTSGLPAGGVGVRGARTEDPTQSTVAQDRPGLGVIERGAVAAKDGRIVFMLERYQIEGRGAQDIAQDLVRAFDQFCAA